VNHKRLMQKLKKLLPPYITSWIAEWLSDRKQRVKCGNTYSLWELIVAGVIQGSLLGPILFLLHILGINEYLPSMQTTSSRTASSSKENHHQDAAYDNLQKTTIEPATTHSNIQRHWPQSCRQIRLSGRSSQ
jgi:hypothetical protein